MPRNRKGAVSVRNRNGNITLVWQYGGKRYYLALGLPRNAKTLGLAEVIKNQIESDIVTGIFDPSLEKYRPAHQKKSPQPVKPRTPFLEEFPKKTTNPLTLDLYSCAVLKFRQYFGNKTEVSKTEATDFIEWLRTQVSVSTAKAYIIRLSAIWDWALDEEKTSSPNPWRRHLKHIKIPPPQPKPFSKEEVAQILRSVQGSHYSNFIEFLFRTGCRLGEAIALKWENVSEDCSRVWVQATKTHNARIITLSPCTQKTLLAYRNGSTERSEYVFTAPKGGRIIANNFRTLVWKPLLKRLGIPYRKPHNMRITLVSHQLEAGVNPVHLSRVTGHSTQTMFRHYLGSTGIETLIPEVF